MQPGSQAAAGRFSLPVPASVRERPWLASSAATVVVLLAFLLRVHLLEYQNIWWDEGWSVWLAREGLGTIALQTAVDTHPPLHYWLLHFWNRAAGENEFAVRFSTVFFGVLAVALVYRLGGDFFGRHVGLAAALFVALSRFHVWWSQEIKMYSLLAALGLASAYCLLKVFSHHGRRYTRRMTPWANAARRSLLKVFSHHGRRYWVGYVLASAAALYVSYLALALLLAWNLAAAAYLVACWRGRCPRRAAALAVRWIAAQLGVGLLYAPWLLYYRQHAGEWGDAEYTAPWAFVKLYATALSVGVSAGIERHLAVAGALTALAVAGVVAALLRRRPAWQPTLLVAMLLVEAPLAVGIAALPGLDVPHPEVYVRYLVIFLPPFALALGVGLGGVVSRLWPLGVALLVGVAIVQASYLRDYYSTRHRTQDLDALASYLEAEAEPGEPLVLNSDFDWPVITYHVRAPLAYHMLPYGTQMSYEEAGNHLADLDSSKGRVWLLTTPEAAVSDPSGAVREWLAGRRPEVLSLSFGRNRLSLYDGSGGGESTVVRNAAFAPRFPLRASLAGWDAVGRDRLPARTRRGDVVYVYTYWRSALGSGPLEVRPVLRAGGRSYGVARQAGVLASGAGDLRGGLMALRQRLVVGRGVPDGRYSLLLELSSAGETKEVSLGSLRVAGGPSLEVESPQVPASVELGEVVRFRGYSIRRHSSGASVELAVVLFWEAVSPMEDNYTVFVHLVSGEGRIWLQHDAFPAGGALPTSVWEPAELVKDEHVLTYVVTEVPDQAGLLVGLYDATTGERLPISGGSGGVVGATAIDLGLMRLRQ